MSSSDLPKLSTKFWLLLITSGYQLILLNCWFFANSVIIPPDAFVVLCPTCPKNLERSLVAMQHPYTKPKGIFWHHKELWREMLSSFVDSLFKVPYGTPIELPHASMWSKLVKIDFTSSLLLSILLFVSLGVLWASHPNQTSYRKLYFNEFVANVLLDNMGIIIFDLRGCGGC